MLFGAIFGFALDKNHRRSLLSHSGFRFAIGGVFVWVILIVPASAKFGAAENYHLEGSLYLALATVTGYAALAPNLKHNPIFYGAHSLGWAVVIGLSGKARISLRDQHNTLMTYKSCMEDLPQPIFVVNRYAALPWLKPGSPHFIFAYNYESDRRAGIKFEGNGIGGLIEKGYFGALLISKRTKDEYDGGNLAAYKRQPKLCANKAVYVKIQKSESQ